MSTRRSKGGPSQPPAKEADLRFPRFVLLKASAGAGKTHALSLWYLQLLLSEDVGRRTPNDLSNILAITFTKNSVREMKSRILSWLKDLAFGDEEKTGQVLSLVSLDPRTLSSRARELLEDILGRYSDFQVTTIDSFMTSVFKASALDLGVPPHFQVVLDNSSLLEYAFSRFLRKVSARSPEGQTFLKISELISASRKPDETFAWDPTTLILEKMTGLYARLNAQTKAPETEDLEARRLEVEAALRDRAAEILRLVESSGLAPNLRSTFFRQEKAIREGRFNDILGASYKTSPVRKSGKKSDPGRMLPEDIERTWREMEALGLEYQSLHARQFFRPYLLALAAFADTLEAVKRRREVVFIEDIPKRLSSYIEEGIVPDIYFRLGDRVCHYLIDEFQDTSPIQWANLRPLIENSLAERGSLLVVGDTKQAIYGFREADYQIMRRLEKGQEGFDSVGTTVKELGTNYRSGERILSFVKEVFLNKLTSDPKLDGLERKGSLSGLTDFHQEVVGKNSGKGHVTLTLLDRENDRRDSEEDPPEAGDDLPEKSVFLDRVADLRRRGYSFSDIAVLTYKNDSVVEISSWLSEAEPPVPFIPFSSLDIRTRAITREILALLTFLDSPPDDLAFAEFLLGSILARKMESDGRPVSGAAWHGFLFECRRRAKSPLYIAFRRRYPGLWEDYFERLFRLVGYYPLYDLASLIYGLFDVFRLFPEEEATLVKLLESVKDFEAAGKNDLGEFLEMTSRQDRPDPAWNIEVPLNIDAVRVMSIHKAKGLEFPVVILLQYGQKFMPPEFFLDARGETVRVLKLAKSAAETDEDFAAVYTEERDRHDVDRMNTLYVALTRAIDELHIICVRSPVRKNDYPFNLLDGSLPASLGRALPRPPRPEPRTGADLTLRFRVEHEAPPDTRSELDFEGVRRGIFFHDLLAGVDFLGRDWEGRIRRTIRAKGEAGTLWAADAERVLIGFFRESPLRAYFERRTGREVFNELQVCDRRGGLFRLDRVVVDPEGVTVLDYKTGSSGGTEAGRIREEEDRAQMRLYLSLASEVFPNRPVRGVLAYLDRGTWEELE
ncbi:MAG: UvrD-helicase domain-containing protein [Candidatus Aminicenantes bacterium]|nr:UvrD-helicase domain-containing protein [Candidatus Aminicenantes bacterium]